ncbi:MAG: DUF885 domain-containing protein, partial [Phycisphaerales bacterium]|nr:DUF885 domain-containing protein [Phycisphaerales bacterium]
MQRLIWLVHIVGIAWLFGIASPLSQASPADDAVLALLAEDLDEQRRANPVAASQHGDRRFDALMPDESPKAQDAFIEGSRDRLARLHVIDRGQLTPSNMLNADLLDYELRLRIDGARFVAWQTPVTQMWGPQLWIPQMPDQLTCTTREQLEEYVRRLEAIPAYLEQIELNMRAGMAARRVPPKLVVAGAIDQTRKHTGDAYEREPTRHPLYAPFESDLASKELRDAAGKAIRESVIPAFVRFGAFLEDEYLPACREDIACSSLPDGQAFYAHQIRAMTSLDYTADQIHRIGMAEVDRIREEMLETIQRCDFMDSEQAQAIVHSRIAPEVQHRQLFEAFTTYLREDPRFYCGTREELLTRYRDIAKRIDAQLPSLFTKLPRLSYGVREMPAFMAPSAPTAYYYPGSIKTGVPGYFVANTHKLDSRPTYEMIALTLHEAVPGHHHQIALAQELEADGLPEWRTGLGYNAFGEGWALYAERLGLEMGDAPHGMYSDPYDDFGRLSYEMWRAMRLVVDTGMHAMGWSRAQAIDFMLANSALTRENIEREVDRYIAWPGQALGYKLGELEIRALREHAETALGDRFDKRTFHDALLEQGALPLPILRERI